MNVRQKIMREQEDPYNIGGYSSSEDEKAESSDDELTVEGLIQGQKRELDSSDEDEFEKEMEVELQSVMKSYERDDIKPPPLEGGGESDVKENEKSDRGNTQSSTTQDSTYSEDYFSSGSDDENQVGGEASKSKGRRKLLTNDELLYDPDMDDEDEKWVAKQRQKHRQKAMKSTSNSTSSDASGNQTKPKSSKQKVETVPGSDAILSCPACMATLCIDCQRHELYKNQYRAMFVMNCDVAMDEVLRYEPSQQKKFGKKKKKLEQKGQKGKLVQHTLENDSSSNSGAVSELYHPVNCTECSTEVGVYDNDEVYHFFNVLTSHA